MHPPPSSLCLVLESATVPGFVGLREGSQWLYYKRLSTPPLESLLPTIHSCIEAAIGPKGFEAIQSICYATGAGSTLGLRLAEMFVRTLQKLRPAIAFYPYHTLVLYSLWLNMPFHHLLCPRADHRWQVLTQAASPASMRLEVFDSPQLSTLPYPIYVLPLRKRHPQLPSRALALELSGPIPASVFAKDLLYPISLEIFSSILIGLGNSPET